MRRSSGRSRPGRTWPGCPWRRTERLPTWVLIGSTVYTAGTDGALRLWDIDGRHRFLARVASAPQHGPGETYGSPAPGGRFVAYTAGEDVTFFDVQSGTVTATVPIGDGFRRKPGGAWHPDGVHFALASGDQIRVWDARNGRLKARVRASGPDVSAIDYSADGDALVVSELSGRVTLLDRDLHPAGRPVLLERPAGNVAAGPDGRMAVALTGLDNASGFWFGERDHWALLDLESGSVVREGDLGFRGTDLDFSPDGRHVAISGGPGALQVLDASTGKFARQPGSSVPKPNWLTYSADGSRVLTSGGDAMGAIWDGDTGELLARVATPERFTVAGFGQRSRVCPDRGRVRGTDLGVGHPAGACRRVRVPRRRPRLHRGRVDRPIRRQAGPAHLPAARRLTGSLWRRASCDALSSRPQEPRRCIDPEQPPFGVTTGIGWGSTRRRRDARLQTRSLIGDERAEMASAS